VVVIATVVFKALRVPAGVDRTRPEDYLADGDDPSLQRLDVLVDGLPRTKVGAHAKDGG
jgi:SSS family solute:Na+ symporter